MLILLEGQEPVWVTNVLSACLQTMGRVMPSFTVTEELHQLNLVSHLENHSQQFTTASIIGNWQLDSQNYSIDSRLDLCTCSALFFPPAHQGHYTRTKLDVIAAMGLGSILFLPWPHWAQLSFVR